MSEELEKTMIYSPKAQAKALHYLSDGVEYWAKVVDAKTAAKLIRGKDWYAHFSKFAK